MELEHLLQDAVILLASAVAVLLSFEVAALILLLGAQVIAEFERCNFGEPEGRSSGFHT